MGTLSCRELKGLAQGQTDFINNGAEIQNEVSHAPTTILFPSYSLIPAKCLLSYLTLGENSVNIDFHE